MSNDLFDTPEREIFRDTVRKFVEEELTPRAREFDEMGRIDKGLFKRPRDRGRSVVESLHFGVVIVGIIEA